MKERLAAAPLRKTKLIFGLATVIILAIGLASAWYFSRVLDVAGYGDSSDDVVVAAGVKKIWLMTSLSAVILEAALFLVYRRYVSLQKRVLRHAQELEDTVASRTRELRTVLGRFKHVMDNAPVAIFVTDQDGILAMREGKGGVKAGVKPGQDVGVSYFEQFNDVPKHLENVRRALAGETVTDRLYVRQGFFEIVYAPVLKDDKSIDGMVGIATDITEQHEIDERLKEQKELMAEVLKNIPEVFFVVASDFSRTFFLSPAFETVWGISLEEAFRDPLAWSKSLFPADREHLFAQLKEVAERGRIYTGDEMAYRIVRPDGSVRWIESHTFPIKDASGKIIQIGGVARDMTENRSQQEDMSRLAAIVQTSPNAIFRKTLDGVIASWNPGAEAMYGYTKEEAVGKPVKMLAPPERHEEIERILAAVRDGRQIVGLETERQRKDGKRFPVIVTVAPIRDEQGRVEAASTVAQDITEQKKNAEKVKELDTLKNKFIQIVSHQFRTPLNAIRWNIEALLSDELGKLKKEQKDFLRITYDANKEVIDRIRDLLTAMDIEEGRLVLNPEEVSLETIWNAVLADWKKRCAIKELDCEYAAPKKALPGLLADGEKIHDVLEKLMDNAVNYTRPKGRLVATLEKVDGSIRFSMKDSGVGIPTVEQPRIFNRFFRASNASTMKTDSSGLGLYISKHFVEQHGGTIGFESKEDEGSTFWFELPLKPKSKGF